MAPTVLLRQDKIKQIKEIISFAEEIQRIISLNITTAGSPNLSTAFTNNLEKTILDFPTNLTNAAISHCHELDACGTSLWNLCTRLRRDLETKSNADDNTPTKLALLMARIYAFHILDCAQNCNKGTRVNALRCMKVSLKIGKNCLELRQHDFMSKVLEKSASLKDALSAPIESSSSWPDDETGSMISEFYILRTALAWRQEDLSEAELMYHKALQSSESPNRRFKINSAESIADIMYDMGREQLLQARYGLAAKWLDRAYAVLVANDDSLTADGSELRVSILQSSVKALIGVATADAQESAEKIVSMLEDELGDKLVVLLLRLEVLEAPSDSAFDGESYNLTLRRMVRSVGLNEKTFKVMIHYIRRLNDKCPSLACKVLDELLQERVLAEGNVKWVEVILVNRFWMATSQKDGSEIVESMKVMLDLLAANMTATVGPSATYAIQTLLWKRVEANCALGQYENAEMWCRLAMHKVLNQTSDLNKAKIARKLISCALARTDTISAQDIFNSMSEVAKNHPLTQVLLFKVAIQSNEVELAYECLERIHRGPLQDSSLLYACVLESKKAKDKKVTLRAFQLVLLNYDQNASSEVHLPALLRCIIKLAVHLLDSKDAYTKDEQAESVEQICKTFEAACQHIQRAQGDLKSKLCSQKELEWLWKNSYNLAIKYCLDWHPHEVYRLLSCTITLFEIYPEQSHRESADDMSLRRVLCDYLASVLLVTLARSADNIEDRLQHYLGIREHVANFDKICQEWPGRVESDLVADDLKKKLCCVLAFDFEAAIQLRAWDDLNTIVRKSEECQNSRMYEIFVDCLLSGGVPHNVLVSSLKAIITAVWKLGDMDIAKLSRYMRVLFQQTLQHGASTTELLDSVEAYIADSTEAEIPYPVEEIEWISTTAFNRAIDFYCAGEDQSCKSWAAKAISIAHYCPDSGKLENLLQTKLLGLNWDAES